VFSISFVGNFLFFIFSLFVMGIIYRLEMILLKFPRRYSLGRPTQNM
jgi:hypothetical protein